MLHSRLILVLAFGLAVACGDDDRTSADAADVSRADTSIPDTGMLDTSNPDSSRPRPDDIAAAIIAGDEAALLAICECAFAEEGYASAAECVAQNGSNEVDDVCFTQAYNANEADVDDYFFCVLTAGDEYRTCFAAAACDDATAGACGDAEEAAIEDCTISDAAGEAFTASMNACYGAMSIGEPSGCPDSDATSMTVGPAAFSGTTLLMGDDADAECGGAGSPDMQLQWTAPSTGEFTIDTIGSSFDTVLYVLDGCAGTEAACNDDAEETGTYQSSVTLTATAGTEYLIVVDGYGASDAGDYVVNITAL